jgi:hypothetical protein
MKNLATLFIALIVLSNCKKSNENTCEYDMCDSQRITIMTATNWSGPLGYYNDTRKWAINVSIPNTIDGIRTCIICTDIPDSIKSIGRIVTFSGNLKESCDKPKPELRGQEIYFVTPTNLR